MPFHVRLGISSLLEAMKPTGMSGATRSASFAHVSRLSQPRLVSDQAAEIRALSERDALYLEGEEGGGFGFHYAATGKPRRHKMAFNALAENTTILDPWKQTA